MWKRPLPFPGFPAFCCFRVHCHHALNQGLLHGLVSNNIAICSFNQLPFLNTFCRYLDFQDPSALAILTDQELVVIDLESPGYPSIEPGHALDIHDSPVTCLKYVPDPNTDLIPGLYKIAAAKAREKNVSKKVCLRFPFVFLLLEKKKCYHFEMF